jgi:hypothetical protein
VAPRRRGWSGSDTRSTWATAVSHPRLRRRARTCPSIRKCSLSSDQVQLSAHRCSHFLRQSRAKADDDEVAQPPAGGVELAQRSASVGRAGHCSRPAEATARAPSEKSSSWRGSWIFIASFPSSVGTPQYQGREFVCASSTAERLDRIPDPNFRSLSPKGTKFAYGSWFNSLLWSFAGLRVRFPLVSPFGALQCPR